MNEKKGRRPRKLMSRASHGAKAKEEAQNPIKQNTTRQQQLQLVLDVHRILPGSLMLGMTKAEIHWALRPGVRWH